MAVLFVLAAEAVVGRKEGRKEGRERKGRKEGQGGGD
jgi:hypothetical protein